MNRTIVKTLTKPDGSHRVEIFRRLDGTFGFEESQWDGDESCWVPFGRYSESFTPSQEEALREAHGRVAWLASPTT
jgi:hypothetical protein